MSLSLQFAASAALWWKLDAVTHERHAVCHFAQQICRNYTGSLANEI